ncbi:MAG: DNA polymerase III subunit gamma/tau [Halioglobus sp.]|nr:DNA polymerase III subunit gamma/tau [Halioglobus sp.]
MSSYQVLARKWRPKTFVEMVGQEHVLRALINALDHDRLHHAYLFTGTRGVGKTTLARILAKCLNCELGVSSTPCGECASCLEIAQGRSIDLLEVDAASRTKVEDTRELLDNVPYAPTRSRYKIYLIDEVHMLSASSFNALLKTLEEPPPHVKFLLATTDPQKLPATVLSRCLQFNLKHMSAEQIVAHLASVLAEEGVKHEGPALWLLGRAAGGSMRDALSLTDQAIAFGSGKVLEEDVRSMLGSVDLGYVYELLEAVSVDNHPGVLATAGRMAEYVPDYEAVLDELLSLLHRVATAQVVPDAIDNSWGDAERVAALAAGITGEDAQLFYQIALNGKRDLGLSPDPRRGFEMILLRMMAFRPGAVIDESLDPTDLQAVPVASDFAGEAGASVKKQLDGSRAPGHESAGEKAVSGRPSPMPTPVSAPQSAAIALSELSTTNWYVLLAQLGLKGMLYNIASHCELRSRKDGALHFVLDEAHATLLNDSHGGALLMALENVFQQPISVTLEAGPVYGETPAGRAARLTAQRQAEAVVSIEQDPQVQALITRFDGELDRASIHPTDVQEANR